LAIAASKLGRFVLLEGSGRFVLLEGSLDAALAQRLKAGLVRLDVADDSLIVIFWRAREEHFAIPEDDRDFNSPHERVRFWLDPYLSEKGRQWAAPLKSLYLPDE
jgi:hypothetical protein